MIFYTMNDAATELKPVINGGSCTTSTVYARINQATRRLMNRNKKPLHIRRLVRFFTYKDIITLPREVEKIISYNMDGAPAPLFGSSYEFVSHGPGELVCGDCSIPGKYLEDLGNHHSLMFDVPTLDYSDDAADNPDEPVYSGHNIVAFSTSDEDRGLTLKLIGRNNRNEALGTPGADLIITPWDNGVEGSFTYYGSGEWPKLLANVRDITSVIKTATTGFVSLYTYNTTTYQLYFLAKYHPQETNPKYRRYRITAPDYCSGSSILAWCELGYEPKSYADDILIIQNIDALKMMVMAIEMENERDFMAGKAYEADAYRLIEEQRMSERTHDYNLIQVSGCYGFGDIRKR